MTRIFNYTRLARILRVFVYSRWIERSLYPQDARNDQVLIAVCQRREIGDLTANGGSRDLESVFLHKARISENTARLSVRPYLASIHQRSSRAQRHNHPQIVRCQNQG